MSEQRAVPEIQADFTVRCHDCGGTQIWKRVNAVEIETYHGCFNGKQSREAFATLTAERDALQATLRQGAESDVDLRKRYTALERERDQYRALMELACADVIFFHSQEHGPFLQAENPEHTDAIGFSVLVNDLFYPAADAEGFDISEAIPLRDVFRKDGMEGIIRWVQQKRDNLPLRPHVEKRVKEREDLRKENADLKQQLADSELAFNHANEVVGKLEADVATHQQHYVDLECLFEKCVSERDGLKATVERVSMSEKVMAAELQAMERRKDDQIAELNRTIERLSAPVSDRQLTEITIERVLRKWADADDNEGINEMSPAEVARKIAADLIASRTAPAKETK